MAQTLLLQGGIVLQHDSKDNVVASTNTDILVKDGRIAQIGTNLPVSPDATVIDCHNKIVSPGFINAHHHMWQSQLKGRLGDCTMLEYIVEANLQSINFTPDDIFHAQLAGCLEALDAGTTYVVDNAHMSAGPEHGTAALAGTVASGIRSRFCYGISPIRAAEWTADSLALDRDPQPAWVPSQLREWSSRLPLTADDRVRLGFFFDSYFLPRDTIRDTLAHVKTLGIDFISSHFRHWPISAGQAKIPEILDECGHLGPDVLLTHGNGLTPEQASLLTAAGTYICSTPDAEISMASGADPVAFRPDLPLTCLGADCHSCGPSSMLHQMQTALSADRGAQTSRTFAEGHYPRRFQATVQRAFNLATIQGARAVGMADQIGSIAVGKLADLVILDASTPSMGCAAHNDPLTAVVRQASVREVDTVIVGGRVCKRDGKLVDVDVSEACGKVGYPLPGGGDGSWSWSQVAEKLRVSRDAVHERIGKVNKELAKKTLHGMMGGLDEILVDP